VFNQLDMEDRMFKELVAKNRSYRRFHQDTAVSQDTLRELVDLARHSGSSGNKQPLKYFLSNDAQTNARIFPYLGWAAYIKEWPGPEEGQRPAAYIVVLGDTEISKAFDVDHGIAAQTILLGAVEKGLGGCMIHSIRREGLRGEMEIPERYDILMVIALGVPDETVILEPLGEDGSIRYYHAADGTHHVPKRSLDELIITF
jgi:nitroreductase